MSVCTYINGPNGKKIRIRNCDLRLMDKDEAKWFVRRYRHICKIEDLYEWWYEKWQLKLHSSVYERILYEYKIQNERISIQYIKNESNKIKSKLILVGNTENKVKFGEI